jgi:hypothetical protein
MSISKTTRTTWALGKMLKTLSAFGRRHLNMILGLAIILVITIIVFRNWIFSPQWPAGTDVLSYISREYLYGKDYKWLFVWRPNSFGYPEGVNLLDFFFMLLRFVAGNAANTAKIFAASSFALAGFAMYAFGYHCTRRNLPALAGSFVYILNGLFLTQLTEAHLDIMFSYAVAPIIFLFLDRALKTGGIKDIAASSILFGIMLTGFNPQVTYIYAPFLGLFVIINLLRPQRSVRFRDSFKFRLKILIIVCALAAVLSACFWIPFLFNVKAPYLSTTFSRGTLEDTYAYGYKDFAEAFTLAGKETGGYINVLDVTKEASLQILPVPTILLLVFAFAYVITLVLKPNRYSFFFGLSALISIIISMGPYSFEPSFLWAWSNIPYFQTFRAISRWGLMTAFSNSFFVCVAASILVGHIQKVLRKPEEKFEVGVNLRKDLQELRSLRVSLPGFDKILHFRRRFLYYSAIFALVAILMSGFISTWFLFSKGLQVYTPPNDYSQPYEYLSSIPGEYKIVAVGRSTNDWLSASGQSMDFSGTTVLTPNGWSHDLGYQSTFIDNKPTIQDGGLSTLSTDFVNYLRFYLTGNNITRNLFKVLGAFDYKYIVIPPYTTENTRAFLMSQYGGQLIYNQSDSIILENQFYTPRIFGAGQFALVFGGPESLSSLCDIDSFDLGRTPVILAYQADNFPAILDNRLNDTAAIIFAGADLSDLIMMPSNDVHLIYLAGYGMQSLNASAYWTKNSWWTNTGAPVLGGDRVLTTFGNNKINIPVELNAEGDYDVWIRVGFSQYRGKLLVSMDGLPLADVMPSSNFWSGLQWINLTSNYHLEAGSHLITLWNDGTGYNDIDAIAVVDHYKLTRQAEETINALQGFSGKILNLIEAEKAFSKTLPRGWSILTIPGDGYALHMESEIISDTDAPSSQIFVPRMGEYNFAARLVPDGESDGTFYLKVDGKLFSISCPANESKAAWLELGSALLDIGEHNISVFASGNITLDKIGIYSASDSGLSIGDMFKSNLSAPSVSYEEVNPCRYVAHVNCTGPFLLVFSESHHSLWKAYVDNKEVSPIIVDSLVNGFFINKTGSFDVVLYFTGQDVADIGLVISVCSTIFVIAVVLAKSTFAKKVKRFVSNRRLPKSF